MNYQQIVPIQPLRKYIRYFWMLEDNSAEFTPKTFKIVPDGLPGLIFQENPNAFLGKKEAQLPQLFLYGQTTMHSEQIAKEPFRNIGVYFQPTALKSIFGLDANELSDRSVDIDDFIQSTISNQLANVPTLERQIELLSSFFLTQISQRKAENEKINFATVQLQCGKTIRHIQNALNISERTLERYFKQHIGISPKLYARISRFQSTLENLRKTKCCRLTDIAYQHNYADQSHFIREFKAFAGTNPKQFMLHANEQVANFPEWKI